MSDEEQFETWHHQGFLPRRLLEEYCSKNGLAYNDVLQMLKFVDYGVYLDRIKRAKAKKK